MRILQPQDMPDVTGGFLNVPSVRPCVGGVLVTGQFEVDRYRDALFETLRLPRPTRLGNAVPKRLAEFLAGRVMAHIAQDALGHSPQPVPIAQTRAPVWPQGLAGSISHTNNRCVCLLMPETLGRPGIDVERLATGSTCASIEKFALTAQDKAFLGQSDLQFVTAATLCFSAKEALFKALFPTVGHYFGFSTAELSAPPGEARLSLRLTETLHPALPRQMTFALDYTLFSDAVMTRVVHSAERPVLL